VDRSGDRKRIPDSEKTPEQLELERKQREDEEKEEEELEKACEKWCGYFCKIGIFVPMLVTYLLLPLREFALRPDMIVDTGVRLSGSTAVVTGGCSGLGLSTATMLAHSGATVVLGCRDSQSSSAALALKKLKKASKSSARPVVWDLQLDSFESVKSFAKQVELHGKLHILVNNAGSTKSCNITEDGIESAFQVNYLGHFLLTNLLLPTLKTSSPSRVVNVVCREGYMRPARGWSYRFPEGFLQGWLGLPTTIQEAVRVGTTRVSSPRERPGTSTQKAHTDGGHELDEEEDDAAGGIEDETPEMKFDFASGCRAQEAYSNAKLAVLSFSHELERRLRNSPDYEGVTSHAVNPNAVLSDFDKGSTAGSERSSPMSYFPPVWVAGKVFGVIQSWVSKAMMRSVDHGAKGIYHVASLAALSEYGGGLFDDTETAFTNCGRKPQFCGRIPKAWLPPTVLDDEATTQLWKISTTLAGLPDTEGECFEEDGVCRVLL